MADFFKSAFSYFSGGEVTHELVGKTVQLSENSKLVIKKVLGEGGFGFVFLVQDVKTNKLYALKKLCVDKDNIDTVKQEIQILKQLNDHPHIVSYVSSLQIPKSHTTHGNTEFLILTELCKGGALTGLVNKVPLSDKQILKIFYETCLAVKHMHQMKPPIIHRDLKIENLLLDASGQVKLCDFGSATTEVIFPETSWSHLDRGLAEENINQNTTPMYRSPEMIDLYSNQPINEKCDIWCLGCMLYKLCYKFHPFEDSTNLGIVNAKFSIPEDGLHTIYHDVIRSCLKVSPLERPTIEELLDRLYSIAIYLDMDPHNMQVELTATHTEVLEKAQASPSTFRKGSQQLWGRVKGGAGSLFKNIKDTSAKVISSVNWNSKSQLDLAYITNRIIVMSYPGNNLEETCAFLDTNHAEQYLVFNLSDKSYDTSLLHNQVADFEWPSKRAPDLEKLVDLCRSLDSWLRADEKNVVVLHCNDGRLPSGAVVAAYLVFIGLFESPWTAYKLFASERGMESTSFTPPPSLTGYIDYISQVVKGRMPHSQSVRLASLVLTTSPRMDRTKSFCRPYVEVFVSGEKVFTSVSKDHLDQIQSYHGNEGSIMIPLNVSVKGNVLISAHHIKSINTDHTSISAVKMFQFQFHSGFINSEAGELIWSRSDLDGSLSNEERFPSPFMVKLDLTVESEGSTDIAPSWQNLPHPSTTPLPCFSAKSEQQMLLSIFSQYDKQALLESQQMRENNISRFYSIMSTLPSHPRDTLPSHPRDKQPQATKDTDQNIKTKENTLNVHDTGTIDTSSAIQNEAFVSQETSNFFSKLNWEGGEDEGYIPYFNEGEESSSSSSSENESEPSPSSEPAELLINLGGTSPLQNDPFSHNPLSAGSNDMNGFHDNMALLDLDTDNHTLAPNEENLLNTTSIFESSKPIRHSPVPPAPLQPSPVPPAPFQTSPVPPAHLQPSPVPPAHLQPSPIPPAHLQPSPIPQAPIQPRQFHPAPLQPTSDQPQSLQPEPKPFDPFADLTSLGSQSASSKTHSASVGLKAGMKTKPVGAGPNYGFFQPGRTSSAPTGQSWNASVTHGTVGGDRLGMQAGGKSYTSVIGNRDERGTRLHAKPGRNAAENEFSDLLGAHNFASSRDKSPRTLKEMKNKEDIANSLDPESAKVKVWSERKERNIRALLCSLPDILWEGNKWTTIGMQQVIQAEQVKKYFRRASLVLHPDKNAGEPHEKLARAIFIELNEAYSLFEETGSRNLY